jgi:cysteinyl-tRNA synthetase
MSKSLGNSLVVFDVVQRVRPVELRWYLVSAHYRSNLEFSDASMQEAALAYRRIEGFLARAVERVGIADLANVDVDAAFQSAMNDDLGVPAALAVIHELVTEGNTLLAQGAKADLNKLTTTTNRVRKMLDILGLDPYAKNWIAQKGSDDELWHNVVDALVKAKIAERQQAREHKDFAKADEIRDLLIAAGIAIEDTPEGARWSIATEGDNN